MIGGNAQARIQTRIVTQNTGGDHIEDWQTLQTITGWLDLQSGDSRYMVYDAKIQESTHIFLADYVPLDSRIKAENSRMMIDGKRYDIMLIDDPMGMHRQLEIYLKYTGGQG